MTDETEIQREIIEKILMDYTVGVPVNAAMVAAFSKHYRAVAKLAFEQGKLAGSQTIYDTLMRGCIEAKMPEKLAFAAVLKWLDAQIDKAEKNARLKSQLKEGKK